MAPMPGSSRSQVDSRDLERRMGQRCRVCHEDVVKVAAGFLSKGDGLADWFVAVLLCLAKNPMEEKMYRKSTTALLATLLVLSLVSCAGAEPTATPVSVTYKVGLNAEYPPFESVDASGNIVGFDPDIISAIAERAGFGVELVNTRWDGIFVALQSGEFDAVISAATIKPERAEIVDFSDPYFNAGQMIAVRIEDQEEITTVSDLDGLKVGVQLGTTGDMWLSDNTKAEVVRYDEITLAFQALGNGDVDAVFNDGPTSAEIIQSNPELDATLVGEPLTDELYGIAVNKGKPDLLAMINEGLAAIRADGTYDETYDKWFGTEGD
jgi:polar amino acid transport system substrate-binding protein